MLRTSKGIVVMDRAKHFERVRRGRRKFRQLHPSDTSGISHQLNIAAGVIC